MKVGDSTATGHIWTPDGLHLELYEEGWHRSREAFYGEGSGGELAKGAMSMGADAETAVKVAMQHDGSTGGEIVTLSH